MTKQLDDMWSSKWVLPEHREALIEDDRNLERKTKPELNDQEIQLLIELISGSLKYKHILTLTLYGDFQPETIIGTVISEESLKRKIKIKPWDPKAMQEHVWISLSDIIRVELKELNDWDTEEFLSWDQL
jgi:hypothetical protein